mmetsp:Transcript_16690/g.51980  ORF Transcript_16690/g.51980 Transcript_16690/m.51980 type:complete len:558 (-) Transcript_16690:25-1698(-)
MLRFVSLSILLGTAAASAAGVDTCAPNACQPAASFLTGVPGASPEIVVSTAGFEAAGLTLDVVAMSAEATRGAEVGTRVRYSADGLRGANDEPPCPFVAVLPTEVSASERSQDRRGTTVSYGRRVVAAAGPSADGADRAEVSLAATCFDDRVALAAATTRKTPSTRKTPCASEIWDYYGECVPETCETWHDGCNECFIHVEEGDMTCTHNHCKVPVHEPMCLEERRPGPQPTSKDCPSDLHDEYGVCIPASCAVWHDGCNRCTIVGEFLSCTEKWCDPKMTKDGFCATKKDAGFDESPAPPPPNDPHCAARDAYWRCVPPGCAMYYDGCNRCAVHGNTLACTKMMCSGTPQATQVGCLVYQGDEDPARRPSRDGLNSARFFKRTAFRRRKSRPKRSTPAGRRVPRHRRGREPGRLERVGRRRAGRPPGRARHRRRPGPPLGRVHGGRRVRRVRRGRGRRRPRGPGPRRRRRRDGLGRHDHLRGRGDGRAGAVPPPGRRRVPRDQRLGDGLRPRPAPRGRRRPGVPLKSPPRATKRPGRDEPAYHCVQTDAVYRTAMN